MKVSLLKSLANVANIRTSLIVFSIVLLAIVDNSSADSYDSTGYVTNIHQGAVRGRYSKANRFSGNGPGKLFTEYFGIKYSSAKRFKMGVQPPKPWKGIFDATKKPTPCFHYSWLDQKYVGTEDCLTINVHTPKTHKSYHKKKMPVMVAIHGGDFSSLSGDLLGPVYFMESDVVFVSFNYRLGVFGFISTDDEAVVANLGLKDQVLALKWVQENIHFFGGDASSITLIGYGTGAAMVNYHMFSPMSKGLFHRAISHSGNIMCPWALQANPRATLDKYAVLIGCDDAADNDQLIQCIGEKDAVDVEAARRNMTIFPKEALFPFGPVVEHWMRNWPKKPTFLVDYPQNLMANHSGLPKIPWLTGVNSMDGVNRHTINFLKNPMEKTDILFSQAASRLFNYGKNVQVNQTGPKPTHRPIPKYRASQTSTPTPKYGAQQKYRTPPPRPIQTEEITKKVREFFFKKDPITTANRQTFIDALTSRNYIQCTSHAVKHYSTNAEVYLYYFSYAGGVSFLDFWNIRKKLPLDGVLHMDELQYFFELNQLGDFPLIRPVYREKSLRLSMEVVKMWISFMKIGKPGGFWTPVPKGQAGPSLSYFNIGNPGAPMVGPLKKEVAFWDSLDLEKPMKLPPLRPLNASKTLRGRTMNNLFKNPYVIYIDEKGDDDGTGGIFEPIPYDEEIETA